MTLCPVEAMTLVSASDPGNPKRTKAKLDRQQCIGCGVCLKACSHGALKLKLREQRVLTPVNSVHRVVLMAVERGKLQNLIFDNQVLFNHRAMAAVLGVILRLPPAKQILASNQFRSRYLLALIKKYTGRSGF